MPNINELYQTYLNYAEAHDNAADEALKLAEEATAKGDKKRHDLHIRQYKIEVEEAAMWRKKAEALKCE